MKNFKNLTELNLYKQKLKYKELLLEKELAGKTVDLVEYFSDKLKDVAFDLGKHLIGLLFKSKKHDVNSKKKKII
jgi:hypothetical protein